MLVGQLGVGRHYPATGVSLLIPRQLALPPASAFDFERLRADAQRLQQRLAAHDRRVAAAPAAPASRPAPRPTYPGSPSPLLSADEQARRKRERKALEQRLLADFNAQAKALYLPEFLRGVMLQARPVQVKPLPAGGRDCFMPTSFWQTQYQETPKSWKPRFKGDKFNHWRDCCNTSKRMIIKQLGAEPTNRVQIVKEHGKTLLLQRTATAGLTKLDAYMSLHKPVMVGVTFVFGTTYNTDLTSDHFIVLVGMGTEKGRKYYRFFDVGTRHREKGTDPRFKLYYDPATGSYTGKGLLGRYTIAQLRF